MAEEIPIRLKPGDPANAIMKVMDATVLAKHVSELAAIALIGARGNPEIAIEILVETREEDPPPSEDVNEMMLDAYSLAAQSIREARATLDNAEDERDAA